MSTFKSCGLTVVVESAPQQDRFQYEIYTKDEQLCCFETGFDTFERAKSRGMAVTRLTFTEMKEIWHGKTTSAKLLGWDK